MNKQKRKYIFYAILITGISGGLSALLTDPKSEWYQSLVKSPLEPPPMAFGIAWGILYLLLTISCAIVLVNTMGKKSGMYIINGILLVLWCLFFFALKMPVVSLIVLIINFILAIFLAFSAYDVKPAAGLMLIPFVLWLAFATYLNYYIVLMN